MNHQRQKEQIERAEALAREIKELYERESELKAKRKDAEDELIYIASENSSWWEGKTCHVGDVKVQKTIKTEWRTLYGFDPVKFVQKFPKGAKLTFVKSMLKPFIGTPELLDVGVVCEEHPDYEVKW